MQSDFRLHSRTMTHVYWRPTFCCNQWQSLEMPICCSSSQGGQLHASCDAAAISPDSTRKNTFRLASAAPAAGSTYGGPCLRNFQARSLGSGGASRSAAAAAHQVDAQDGMLSEAKSRAHAAATWLYETQWQAATSATGAAAERSGADGVKLHSGHTQRQWSISSTSGMEAASHMWSRTGSSSATAVAAVAELVRVLQQQIQTAVPDSVTISTFAAVPAAISMTAYSSRGPANAAAQAGAALGGAVCTAILEDPRLDIARVDAPSECSRAQAAAGWQERSAAACRAGATYLPR